LGTPDPRRVPVHVPASQRMDADVFVVGGKIVGVVLSFLSGSF
jgi:hypothetical protein